MEEATRKEQIERKRYRDKLQSKKGTKSYNNADDNPLGNNMVNFSRVLNNRLWVMVVVETACMAVGHTYPTNEIVQLRICEEANLSGCQVAIVWSDNKWILSRGRMGHPFLIRVSYSISHCWNVIEYEVSGGKSVVNIMKSKLKLMVTFLWRRECKGMS